jgi:hypothetical protein
VDEFRRCHQERAGEMVLREVVCRRHVNEPGARWIQLLEVG